MIDTRLRVVLSAVALLVAACRRPEPTPPPVIEAPTPQLPAEPRWPTTLEAVLGAVNDGRFAAADSILATFERVETGTAAAQESAFWRVLLSADPRNPAFSPANARSALEGYIASPTAVRRPEAAVMLRLLSISDSLRTAAANARTAAEQRDQRDRAREEELQRLRDDLQRTREELERIKRRLGSKP